MISFGRNVGAVVRHGLAVGVLLAFAACSRQDEPSEKIRVTEFAMAQRAASLEKVRPYG